MKFKAILDGIQEITTKQIDEIETQTAQHVKDIKDSYTKETRAIRTALEKEGQIRLQRESALIEQQAEMQYLQNVADARQQLIQESLDAVKVQLQQVRQSPEKYKPLLFSLIDEAIQDLIPSLGEDKTVVLSLDPRDKNLIQDYLWDKNIPCQFEFNLDCWGGCNASSTDAMVCVYNTLDQRFRRALPILQQKLSRFFNEKTVRET